VSSTTVRAEIKKQASIWTMNLRLVRVKTVAAVIVVIFLLLGGWLLQAGAWSANWGFGSGWSCTAQTRASLFCVQHPPNPS
jgi:hypothetical protein